MLYWAEGRFRAVVPLHHCRNGLLDSKALQQEGRIGIEQKAAAQNDRPKEKPKN